MDTKTNDSTTIDKQTIFDNKSTGLHKSYGSLPELDMIDRNETFDYKKYDNIMAKPEPLKKEHKMVETFRNRVEKKNEYSQADKEAILAKVSLYLMDLKNKYSSSNSSSAEVDNEKKVDGLTLLRNAYDSLSELGSDEDFEEFDFDDSDTLSSYSEDEYTTSTKRNSITEEDEQIIASDDEEEN